MGNILREALYVKAGGESISGLFLKNQNLAYHWINSLNFYAVCFHCVPS